jgi:deoxyribonuclease V
MIAALDVHYDEISKTATAAAVVFEHWEDENPVAEYTASCACLEPYIPGEFFKRELPCLLAALGKVRETLSLIVIDGYVLLGNKPGLGMRLWEALPARVPIIGVAKTRFHSAPAVEIMRGESKSPLFITAVGVDPAEAAEGIRKMHGPFRIPTLLKRADQLARGWG